MAFGRHEEKRSMLPQHNRESEAAKMRKRGPHSWHLKAPRKVSGNLALKNHFVAMIGEYVGTCLFMIFALGGTNVANIPTTSVTGATTSGQDGSTAASVNTSSLLYIALCFGFSLAVNAWIFFRVSGGLFNPAVSLGMMLVGALAPVRAGLLVVSQILGGITGAAIIQALLPGTLNVRTQLAGGTSVVQGLFIEMFLTAMLMITILLLAAEKHKATFLAPIGIGLALFIAEMMGVYYTGGSLNPARSFGPDVVLRDFSSYHWIYWLGPAMGATLAAGFYRFIKFLEYETVLGPEEDDDNGVDTKKAGGGGRENEKAAGNGSMGNPPGMNDAGAAPSMLGQGGGKAGKGNNNFDNNNKDQSGGYDTQGPGIGDLLTRGNAGLETYSGQSHVLEGRLDTIEIMLGQLLYDRHGGSPSHGHGPRDSAVTVVHDPSLSPVSHKKGNALVHDVRGDDVAYPNRILPGASPSARGETTLPGHPKYGAPLGPAA